MKFQQRTKGIIFVIIASMLWGVSGTVAQYLFQKKEISAEWLVVIRLLVSGLTVLLYALKTKQDIWHVCKVKKDFLKLTFFGILGMLGVQYTYFATIKYGNAATATILQYLCPVIITCYVAIYSKKIPSLQQVIAIAMAMLGTFCIITKGDIHSIAISKLTLIWGISSAFAAALYTLQSHDLIKKWSSTIVVGWGMLIGGIAFSFVHQPWNITGKWDIYSSLGIIFVVVFGTLIPFYFYLESLKYIQPTEASILSSIEPLSAVFLSVLWLHVSFGLWQFIGTVCIISTVIILSYVKTKKV